jgi:PLP dependent protein
VIAARVAAVRERIARAAARAGRKPEDVTLVAVSKTFPVDAVREGFAAGLRDFGENKVQEAEGKARALTDLRARGLRLHLVGHLQKNKAKKAVAIFDMVQSIDGLELARDLERCAAQQGKVVRALVQVDLAGEETKFGLAESLLFPALEKLRGFKSLPVHGLMVLPPFAEAPEQSRPFFRRLRDLRDRAVRESLLLGSELSMGMSHDFDVAVEEGATIVRVGTAIFGERATNR